MPQATIYIRPEDWPKYRLIKKAGYQPDMISQAIQDFELPEKTKKGKKIQ